MIAKIVLSDLDLLSECKFFLNVNTTETVRKYFADFSILPSNDVIAKIELRDLDLLFEGKKFETSISLKQ